MATRGINEPKSKVERMTSARTLATTNSYSVKKCSALIANPRAIAPRIIPAYERKTHSLNLRDRLAPKHTKMYCTVRTETIRAKTIKIISRPMKDRDQSYCGYAKIPRPI